MNLLEDPGLYVLQLKVDEELATQAREAGCGLCRGRLDAANYPRKPRGVAQLPAGYDTRFSFCCAKDGCRRRTTPASMRFLGRKVYLGAVVVLASAMRHGITPVRAARLHKLLGVSLRTLARWRDWWRTAFAQSPFWKKTRALLARPVGEQTLPLSLLDCFSGDEQSRLVSLLRLLLPITTSSQ
jgi:hypothetical protein